MRFEKVKILFNDNCEFISIKDCTFVDCEFEFASRGVFNNNIISVYSLLDNNVSNDNIRIVNHEEGERVTFPITDFLQNIKQTSENFIAGRLISQRGSPVGNIVALKHLHGWEESRQGYEQLQDDNSQKTLDSIANRMGVTTTKDN